MQTLFYCFIILLHTYQALNTYNKSTGPNGEDIWQSTSDFIAQEAKSYGTIKIGHVMIMEFYFQFHNRSDVPRPKYENNFFRIGHSAINSGCDEGTRYPSMWLESGEGFTGRFDISVTDGLQCDNSHYINKTQYGYIPTGLWMHITITIDHDIVSFAITGARKPNYRETWNRLAITRKEHLGDEVPVWFISDKGSGTGYNIGDATFRDIKITSHTFTYETTANPTAITGNPSISPSAEPSEIPSKYPSIAPVTALPTLSPVPTTAVPTDSPVTQIPTNSPITHKPTTDIPTISPVEEGEVIEVSTTVIVVVNDEDDDGSSDSTTVDNATIGMIIAVCAVGCCILIGAGILHNKRKDVSDDEGDFTAKNDVFVEGNEQFSVNVQQIQMHQQSDKQLSPVYTPDGVVKQEVYLSKAQKQELYSTAQGPRTDDVDEWQRDEPCVDYLSAAQREELKKNGMNTAGNKVDNEYLSAAQKEELKKLTPGKINVQLQKEESEHLSDDDVVANLTPGIDTSSSHPEWKHMDEVQHVIVDNVKNEGSETSEVQIEDKMTIGVQEILDDEYDVQYDDEVEEDDEDDNYDIDGILEDDDDDCETMQ